MIGNLYDPATRYQGAQLVAGLLPDSALLTVDVPGHTSLGASPCAGDLTGAYLLDPAQAATIDGVVCPARDRLLRRGRGGDLRGARTPAPAHAGRRGAPLTGIAAHWTREQPRTQPRRDRLRAGRRVRGRGDRPAGGAPGWPAGDAGPAHPALAGAVAGRRLVLRRPLRARCRRGHRRDVGRAAPAHRAADRELALHRRDRAPRQRRAPRDGPSRRAEPDDRRPRHQPLRGVPARHDRRCTASSCGWRCPTTRGTATRASRTTHRPRSRARAGRPGCSSARCWARCRRSRPRRRCSAPSCCWTPERRSPSTWTRPSSTGCWSTPGRSRWRVPRSRGASSGTSRRDPTGWCCTPSSKPGCVLLGGPPFGEQIMMWWNFVGRTHEEIVGLPRGVAGADRADGAVVRDSQDVAAGRFGVVLGDHLPPIPAPEMPQVRLRPRG